MNLNLVDRLKEFSTWEGLTVLAGMLNYVLVVDEVNLIGAALAALYSVFKMFKKEK
ncbi:MAG: hypothetical protein ACERKJ_11115 [Candidatus Dadabacteria bacterium]